MFHHYKFILLLVAMLVMSSVCPVLSAQDDVAAVSDDDVAMNEMPAEKTLPSGKTETEKEPESPSVRVAGSWSGFKSQEAVCRAFWKETGIPAGMRGRSNSRGLQHLANGEMEVLVYSPEVGKPLEKLLPKYFAFVEDQPRPRAREFGRFVVRVVVHEKNPVKRLTLKQLAAIYAGKITNWQQVGGRSGKIVRYAEPFRTKSNEIMRTRVLAGATFADYKSCRNQHAITAAVKEDTSGIGFCLYRHEDMEGVRAVSLAESKTYYEPTAENIYEDLYPLYEPLWLIVRPDAVETTRQYVEYACGEQGVELAKRWFLYPEAERKTHMEQKRLADMRASRGPKVLMLGEGRWRDAMQAIAETYTRREAVLCLSYKPSEELTAIGAMLKGLETSSIPGLTPELFVTDAPISKDTLEVHGAAWEAAGATSHVIAARGIAVVANAANPMKELSVQRLRQIAKGDARTWQVALSGTGLLENEDDPWVKKAETLNFYTPDVRASEISLFREQVLDGKYYRWWKRQKTGDEVIRKLASDPYGLGIISVTDIPAGSTAVRVLAIASDAATEAQDSNAILPSRQSIFLAPLGGYPLSKRLTIYVSPKASEATRRFVEFLTSGGESTTSPYADVPYAISETMAKHGLLSTMTEIILPTPEIPKPKPKKKPDTQGGGKPKPPVGTGGGDIPGGW